VLPPQSRGGGGYTFRTSQASIEWGVCVVPLSPMKMSHERSGNTIIHTYSKDELYTAKSLAPLRIFSSQVFNS